MSHSRSTRNDFPSDWEGEPEMSEPEMTSFVHATQWNDLRKLYPPIPSRARGLRPLSQAMESENPENLDCSGHSMRWNISPMDCSSAMDMLHKPLELAFDNDLAELDACYASETFLDDLDWALQTYEICQRDAKFEDTMDEELEMLEAVQDLTRFVTKVTPRRAASAPSTPSIPD